MMFRTLALTSAFVLGLGVAAQAQSPQIPTIANPNPANPVATDGSPLPHNNTINAAPLLSGRSAAVNPVGGIVGTGVDAATGVVNLGVGAAAGAVDTGLGVTGAAVGTGLNATGAVVR